MRRSYNLFSGIFKGIQTLCGDGQQMFDVHFKNIAMLKKKEEIGVHYAYAPLHVSYKQKKKTA